LQHSVAHGLRLRVHQSCEQVYGIAAEPNIWVAQQACQPEDADSVFPSPAQL
jgi:hypothetical protein